MVYITGDTHGVFKKFNSFCYKNKTTKEDVMIVLGDFGLNFYTNNYNNINYLETKLAAMPLTFFCIHGNHEARPEHFPARYKEKEWNGGIVFCSDNAPNVLFAKDGEIYNINNKKVFVCGGAYSVDKYYRLNRWLLGNLFKLRENLDETIYIYEKTTDLVFSDNIENKLTVDNFIDTNDFEFGWWKDEQPSEAVKKHCEDVLQKENWDVDIVLTHTCPLKYEPKEMFIEGIAQDLIDKSTEEWLDKIENKLNYKKWYCGHFHTDKVVDNIEFMHKEIKRFD